jgi:uncharacterized protein
MTRRDGSLVSMSARFEIKNLHGFPPREALLRMNNASARDTSLLTFQRLDQLIESARVALFVPPATAVLLAFEHSGDYGGAHFLWFRNQFDRFLYIDRVVVSRLRLLQGCSRPVGGSINFHPRSQLSWG